MTRRFVSIGYPTLYWRGERLVLHEPASNRHLLVTPFAVQLLDYLRTPRSHDDVYGRFNGIARSSLRRAVAQLRRYGLVGNATDALRHPLDGWSAWAPHASAFHFATKDPVIAFGERGQRVEDELLARERCSPPVPVGPRQRPSIQLPAPSRADGFSGVVRGRRTWRVFGADPVPLADLSEALHLAFGVQRWAATPAGSPVALTTSPSAGGRQPLTAYVAARRIAGVAPGLYRYDAAQHGLALLSRGMSTRRLERYLGHNWWFADAGAAVFITGRVGEVAGRYDHPRAYRFLLLEAGHVCQTFLLACTWKNLAPFCTAALADSMIERDLGIDGFEELVLYAAGVGTRPKGGYQQWPDHDDGQPYIKPARKRKAPARRSS